MAKSNPSWVSVIGPIQQSVSGLSSDSNAYTQALLEAIVILLHDIRLNIIEEAESRSFAMTDLTSTLLP